MFDATFEALSGDHPQWGQVGILPWDVDIFDFPVGEYRVGDLASVVRERARFREAFSRWSTDNHVEVIACTVPAEQTQWCALLQDFGFNFVDYTLRYTGTIEERHFPLGATPVRLAVPEDQESAERIAEHAFQVGRYHADARFPRALADRRYRRWMHNIFASLNVGARLYVTGEPKHVSSFFYVRLHGDAGDISIMAVDPALQRGPTRLDLTAAALTDLQSIGVRSVGGTISAVNCRIMNLVSYFTVRFSNPLVVFHWHAADAPHLLPLESLRS